MNDSLEVYEGEFIDGKLNGEGKIISKYGTVYEGIFADGELNGEGRTTRSDGHIIKEGNFVNGKLNGKGERIYRSGTKDKGKWENGKLINGYKYDKNGKKVAKYVNGERKKVGIFGF